MVFTDQHAMLAFILVGKTLLSVIEEKMIFKNLGINLNAFYMTPEIDF